MDWNGTTAPAAIVTGAGPRYHHLELALLALTKYVPFFTCAVGIPGNFISFLVTMKKDNRRISTCIYMAAIAVMDTMVLFGVLGLRIVVMHGVGKAITNRMPMLG